MMRVVSMLGLAMAVACASDPEVASSGQVASASGGEASRASTAPNVLLVIADDMGVDALGTYGLASQPPRTPHLDALASSGVVFDSFWVTPACTTTRAALITGQHGFESTIDHVPAVMPDSATTLQQRLKADDLSEPYATGVFGKWHLGGPRPDPDHPRRFGIDRYAGNLANLRDYESWTLTEDGVQREETSYHTSRVTDLALEFIRESAGRPWFAWVAYAAPHSPFHAPPASLVSKSTPTRRPQEQYLAMIEAMDTEIGRLVEGLPQEGARDTLIVFLGDNGTPKRGRDRAVFEADHVKGTLHEGGIRTPLIASGGPVKRRGEREGALVNATDLFATVVELATGTSEPADIPTNSMSFRSLLERSGTGKRTHSYSEWRTRDSDVSWAVRDATHKVIQHADGRVELFATSDVSERQPLQSRAIEQALLSVGRALRSGGSSGSSATPPAPSAAGGTTPCATVAGQSSHAGRDVLGSRQVDGRVSIDVEGQRCAVRANGVPDHDFNDGQRSFPFEVAARSVEVSFPLHPRKAARLTGLSLSTDDGVLLNGVKIDMLAAACFGVGDERTGCHDAGQPWRFDPAHGASTFRMDRHLAHSQPDGSYHYHGVVDVPREVRIIGFAADGFPIRTPWVLRDGQLRELRSSYRLKSGARVDPGGGAPFPGGRHDGTYRDDWEHVDGWGDLDECNGADLGDGYSYYATETFPYYLGCFVGTPDPSFAKQGAGDRARDRSGMRGERRGQGGRRGMGMRRGRR
ncbi:MAG: sulfatase-like hydrolase/transferase [Acidobacteriota bacterium]